MFRPRGRNLSSSCRCACGWSPMSNRLVATRLSGNPVLKRKPLYSRGHRRRSQTEGTPSYEAPAWHDEAAAPPFGARIFASVKKFATRHQHSLPAAIAAVAVLAFLGGWRLLHPEPAALSQWDI